MQPHLGKCFEGINKVKFEADLKISQIISTEGEEVMLERTVDPETSANKGNVEKWLLEIESIQWDSIRTVSGLFRGIPDCESQALDPQLACAGRARCELRLLAGPTK